ncbi:MAG TPA: sugar phosphate nucleotidyltransferase [Fimbriimonadaceae bacterium]|jgi:glucose-1-phosphate cytidylyltransferase
MNFSDVPVFILAGGLGTRIREETEFRPKPMVPIGDQPVLWHIMKKYNLHGFSRFVVCTGYKSEIIKSYFLNYDAMHSDFTVDLHTHRVTTHSTDHEEPWQVTVSYTGEKTMTGSRVRMAASRYLGAAEHFAVTYGDGLTDVDLAEEFAYHKSHGKIGTVLGISPASRFGEFMLDGDTVLKFSEKPAETGSWINGGFFFFKKEFLEYLPDGEDVILERDPLQKLSDDRELNVFLHRGFWQCMDTQRDRELLEAEYLSGKAPWLKSGAKIS